ncbi:hypothetical protein LOTGIDRAFT_233046 [Lottia gigantea]|uniref:DNA excision repair protein ERCC-8 n=1 Tax=Lottia gigantea TaxID=225164 RepID=V3ZMK1_LOTGI|nr:hypothetical protein LOTGIDRAFT_233046 [Lottia gigantea]ESO92598.1 hypothetical protein LOTGIDRAFT_233046 [Lottia gigantea]
MLKFLTSRESGSSDPSLLRRAEVTRRIYSLELSKHRDIEKSNALGVVNALDIDSIENRYLLSGGGNGGIAIHDLEDLPGEDKLRYRQICHIPNSSINAHKRSVETVQWYPLDTGLFTTSGTDKELKVWDTNKLLPADSYSFEGIIYSHHMSPVSTKHSLIAVGCEKSTIKLIDLRAGSYSQMLKGHKSAVLCVKWSTRDEFILASGSSDNGVLLWDIRKAKGSIMSLDQHNGEAASAHNKVKTAHNGRVNGLCFTDDGLHLVTFGTDNRLRLWNTNTGKNSLVNYGSISNDGRKSLGISVTTGNCPDVIMVPDDSNLMLFNLHEGTRIKILRGHYNQVNCCVYHCDKQELYSGGNDRNILVWLPSTDDVYENCIKINSKEKSNFTSRIAATTDTWSDEDD